MHDMEALTYTGSEGSKCAKAKKERKREKEKERKRERETRRKRERERERDRDGEGMKREREREREREKERERERGLQLRRKRGAQGILQSGEETRYRHAYMLSELLLSALRGTCMTWIHMRIHIQ